MCTGRRALEAWRRAEFAKFLLTQSLVDPIADCTLYSIQDTTSLGRDSVSPLDWQNKCPTYHSGSAGFPRRA